MQKSCSTLLADNLGCKPQFRLSGMNCRMVVTSTISLEQKRSWANRYFDRLKINKIYWYEADLNLNIASLIFNGSTWSKSQLIWLSYMRLYDLNTRNHSFSLILDVLYKVSYHKVIQDTRLETEFAILFTCVNCDSAF